MRIRRAVTLAAASAVLNAAMIVGAPVVQAGPSCPSSDSIPPNGASGTVTSTSSDWYRWRPATPGTVTMQATAGDPDLIVKDEACVTTICYPFTGAATESCDLPPGAYNVGILYFSGGSASYTLTASPEAAVPLLGCDDGLDNDRDGTVDAATDPGCSGPSDTNERGSTVCDNGVDDDNDGAADAPDDPGCNGPSDSSEVGSAACENGADDDGDGAADLADGGCDTPNDPSERGLNICDDGNDNDSDGTTDYPGDAGCAAPWDPTEETVCQDGVDNDLDGSADGSDPGCAGIADGDERGTTACDNGVEDDGDGLRDYPADPGCSGPADGGERGSLTCDNGVDDDFDGAADYPADPGCRTVADPNETTIP